MVQQAECNEKKKVTSSEELSLRASESYLPMIMQLVYTLVL